MKNRTALAVPAIIAITIGVVVAMRSGSKPETRPAQTQPVAASQQPPKQKQPPSSHAMPTTQTHVEGRVPAHFKSSPATGSLPPTLEPGQFTGPTREAYKAVKEIPQTIAQLPCYCYCDESFGHKSLHSCFEDDHGAHCAVCVNEVLMAYRMEKELKLNPAEIRERIVAYYSAQMQ